MKSFLNFIIIDWIFFFNFIKTSPLWIKKSIFFFYIIINFFLRIVLFFRLILIPILNTASLLGLHDQVWIASFWNIRNPISLHIRRNILILLAIISLNRQFITITWISYWEWCSTDPNCFSNNQCLLILWFYCWRNLICQGITFHLTNPFI